MRPNKGVELLVTAGTHPTQVTMSTNLFVVSTPSAYNVTIGHPTLNALRAVASTYHLALKFSMPAGVEVVLENQVEARRCYALALKEPPDTWQETNAIESIEQPS